METLWHDLGYGSRLLFKNLRFTVVAILSLAIGIGATTAIFSVTNALLLRSADYADSADYKSETCSEALISCAFVRVISWIVWPSRLRAIHETTRNLKKEH